MKMPAFFDQVPRLVLRDPLAQTLGAAQDGLIEYSYADVVKLAGHSCPTVAGAYLMTRAALARLYPGETPTRGGIYVEVRQQQGDGVAGVIGAVVGLITGAAGEGGFKGLGGRHARNGLLRYGVPMSGELHFARTDGGASVEVAYQPDTVRRPEGLRNLMQRASGPDADDADRAAFAETWQQWVRTILIDHMDDSQVVQVVAHEP